VIVIPLFLETPTFSGTQLCDVTPWIDSKDLEQWKRMIYSFPRCTPQGPWILGSAIRHFFLDEAPTDFDYFFASETQFYEVQTQLFSMPPLRRTPHHVTYTSPHGDLIQLVHTQFHPTMRDHFDHFDFTLCQTGWDGSSFWMTEAAYRALNSRTIHLTPYTPYSLTASWSRLLKYAAQQYTISLDTFDYFLTHVREHGYPHKETYHD